MMWWKSGVSQKFLLPTSAVMNDPSVASVFEYFAVTQPCIYIHVHIHCYKKQHILLSFKKA